jgi:hypothetical protein
LRRAPALLSFLKGQGTGKKHLKAGDSCPISAGAIRDATIDGDKLLKIFGIYAVDKTTPLASPAP